MALTIQRLNFDPVTGDNPSEAFMKLDVDVGEITTAIDGDGTPGNPGIDARLAAVEGVSEGLGNAATKDVGTAVNTVAAGDDIRFLRAGFRNELISGGFVQNQRGFAGGNLVANTYGYDRWRTFGSAASITVAADGSTITLNGTIGQIIEDPGLDGATVTVSVQNPTGPITVNLRPSATTAGVTGVIPLGSGVQSVTLVVPSSITGDLFLLMTTTSPVSFDGFGKRGGVQIEAGSFASNFERRPAGLELILCQRYFEIVAPSTVMAAAFSATDVFANVAYMARKRATPSILVTAQGNRVGNGSSGSMTASTISIVTTTHFNIDWTSFTGSVTQGLAYGIRGFSATVDSEL